MNMKLGITGAVFLLLIFLLSGCMNPGAPYERITILGETAPNGIYDPSIEYEDAETGWMAYSTVAFPEYVHTHLAKSIDHGKTWTYVMTINQAVNGSVTYNGTELKGAWRHEVPTLVHDPNDAGKEWKLFWHKYFTIPPYESENRLFVYGWIVYKYAPNPTGPWSEEIPLFGSGIYPLDPYEPLINLSGLHENLHEIIIYSEPGSIVVDDVLYLSITGHIVKNDKNLASVILLSSTDHGRNWTYVNTLLENKDAEVYGGLYLSGSSLARENDTIYLLACPIEESGKSLDIHHGTCIFVFEDITNGTLKRDATGAPVLHKYLQKTLVNGGQSDYDEQNTYGGIVMPQLNLRALPEAFQLYNTKETMS